MSSAFANRSINGEFDDDATLFLSRSTISVTGWDFSYRTEAGKNRSRMHASVRIAFTDLAPTWDNCVEDEVIN